MNKVIWISVILIFSIGCGPGIRGKGEKIRKELDLKTFDKIELDIMADIFLTQGDKQKVDVEAQENIIKNLKTKVSDKKLEISSKSNVRFSKGITFYITIPEFEEIDFKGSGDIRTTDVFLDQDAIELKTSDLGDYDLHLEAESIDIEIKGAGDVDLAGNADKMNVKIQGPGDLDAYDMVVNSCKAEIEGVGNVKINVIQRLEAVVKGRGNILYMGNPEVIAESTGSGKIRAVR